MDNSQRMAVYIMKKDESNAEKLNHSVAIDRAKEGLYNVGR